MKLLHFLLIVLVFQVLVFFSSPTAQTKTVEQGGKTFIVDQLGERWDITQAVSIGYKPKHFEFGIGRDAFQTLDDSFLTQGVSFDNARERVIGIDDGQGGKAFSVDTLRGHEIANTWQQEEAVSVAY